MDAPGFGDVRVGAPYETVRDDARRWALELKRDRRVSLGPVTVVFENQSTMALALEEALRAGRLTEPQAVAAEIEAFSGLLPEAGELCACVYLDASDQAELAGRLVDLAGLGEAIHMEIDGSRVQAVCGAVPVPDQPPAVTVLKFRPDGNQRAEMEGGARVVLSLDHPRFQIRVELSLRQRAALVADLSR